MSLVKLTGLNGTDLFLNASKVIVLKSYTEADTEILLVGGEGFRVKGKLDEVAEKLNRLGG